MYKLSKSGRLIVPDEGVRGYRPSDVSTVPRNKGIVARSFWLLRSLAVVDAIISQAAFDLSVKSKIFTAGKPEPDAIYLAAIGGVPINEALLRRPLTYRQTIASDPETRSWSKCTELIAVSGQVARFRTYRIPNHHSVTFDATSTVQTPADSGTTLSFNHTVAVQASPYINAMVTMYTGAGADISGITFNSVSFPAEITQKAGSSGRTAKLWALANNQVATGTNQVVITFSGSSTRRVVAVASSAYGVDQTTPHSNIATGTTGTGTAPSITITSAVGELAYSVMAWEDPSGLTATVDATWTTDFNSKDAVSGTSGGAAAHIAGAASVTRTDTLPSSQVWAMVGVSVKAAAAAGGSLKRNSSLNGLGASGGFFHDPLSCVGAFA